MKYKILILAITLNSITGISQQKGAKTLEASNSSIINSSTYAVVVGISDYQDPAIPDLQFSHKDAEAFANYLRSNAGGNLDNDHLKVLLNEQATMGQFAIQLDWLLESVKENDRVIIYFSGHGDVEKKTLTQPGFLLCWDAPAQVYMSGGAFALPMLQEVISTLSIQNKAKVIVITDACRSGKLSGSSINGNQLTNANLAKQYANEIKILSCQPNEYSIEGEQWGGGRGAFSYHLVNALYGMADNNNDLIVNLQEAGRYLEDHVTAEVAPVSQIPMFIGNRSEQLTNVDVNLLSSLKAGKTNQMVSLSSIDSKGIEEEVLNNLDTSIKIIYRLFKQTLKDRSFFEPINACADNYYEKLIRESGLVRLHSTMKRNYAATLQDDAQQTLKEWMKTSQDATLAVSGGKGRLSAKVFTEKVRSFPRCLDRAAELLGSHHYMYISMMARKYFFEGYLLANSNRNPNKELGDSALKLFRKSLEWQADQPQVYWQMSRVFGWNLLQPDSLEHYTRRAMELHPNWITPYTSAAFLLSVKYKQQGRARQFMEQANRIDSNSAEVLNQWAGLHLAQKNFDEAERQFKKAIELDSTFITAWSNLGYLFIITGRYAEAELVYKKAIGIDSTKSILFSNLGMVYNFAGRFKEALPFCIKAYELDSTNAGHAGNLGAMFLKTSRYKEAEPVLKKAIALDSMNTAHWVNLGLVYNHTLRYLQAESILKKAIELDSTSLYAWNNLGATYLNTNRYDEAEQQFKKVITLDSTFFNAWNDLGVTYLNKKKYNEAERILKKAIALDSTSANPRKHLGMVCFRTNRPEEARQNFIKAIELNPNYFASLLGMSYLLISEGKMEEAFSYVERAINKNATMEKLESDKDLAQLREQKERWQQLMKKYFPENN